jgi:predicted dehydrogenase
MHASVYRALPDVEIVGIADSFPGVKALAAKLGIATTIAPSLTALLKMVDCNVVDICLPTDLHVQTLIVAARAGKHIFCEKPLALEVAHAEKALREVKKAGVALQVGQCIRFWPEYQALERFMKSGRGGRLVSLSLQRRASRPDYSRDNWLHKSARSKGAALDLHIHDTDYILHLLGKPKGVHSVGRKQNGAWSHLFTNYIYPNTAVTAEGGWDLPPNFGLQMAFQTVFEDAYVDFDSSTSPSLHLTLGRGKREPMPFLKPTLKSSGATTGNISDLGGYFNELAYFCTQLRKGKKPAIATGPQALESLRTVLAEIKSATLKKIVAL